MSERGVTHHSNTTHNANFLDQFRAIFATAAATCLLDDRGHIMEANQAMEAFLGSPAKSMLGMPLQNWLLPEHRGRLDRFFDSLNTEQDPIFCRDICYLRADTSFVWGTLSFSVIRDNEGAILAIIAINVDITERKESDSRLQFRLLGNELIHEIAHNLLETSTAKLYGHLPFYLESLAEFLQADALSLVFLGNANDPNQASFQYLWEGETENLHTVHKYWRDIFLHPSWSAEHLALGKNIAWRTFEDMPREARQERYTWEQSGVRQVLASPLENATGYCGFLLMIRIQSASLQDSETPVLESAARIFSGLAHRHQDGHRRQDGHNSPKNSLSNSLNEVDKVDENNEINGVNEVNGISEVCEVNEINKGRITEELLQISHLTATPSALTGNIREILQHLQKLSQASYTLFMHHTTAANLDHFLHCIACWPETCCDPGASLNRLSSINLTREELTRWSRLQEKNIVLQAAAGKLPEVESHFLASLGIQRFMIIPVHIDKLWHSSLLIADTETARDWEAPVSRSVELSARMIGASLAHLHTQQTLVITENSLQQSTSLFHEAMVVVNRKLQIEFINQEFRNWCLENNNHPPELGNDLFAAIPFLPDNLKPEFLHIFTRGESQTIPLRHINDCLSCKDVAQIHPITENGHVARLSIFFHNPERDPAQLYQPGLFEENIY